MQLHHSRLAESRLSLKHLPADQRTLFEQAVGDFERAWHTGQQPQAVDYVPETSPQLKRLILDELNKIDDEFRLSTMSARTTSPDVGTHKTLIQPNFESSQAHSHRPVRIESMNCYANAQFKTQGGLGEILVADDCTLGRQVVIKRMKRQWVNDSRAIRWFLQEAEITGRLEHPGIIPIHARGTTDDGVPWYSMRLIEGTTLKEQIHRFHSHEISPAAYQAELRSMLGSFMAACRTVAYAHSRQILHRDLKPENIMLGPFGETIVLDWGLAKRLDQSTTQSEGLLDNLSWAFDESSGNGSIVDTYEPQSSAMLTITGDMLGTPAYMSPEQARGEASKLGTGTDIFGLGAVLYAILCGRGPFLHQSLNEALRSARACELEPIEHRNPRVPKELGAICRRALAPLPEQRYGSALELARDIDNYLADQPVTAMAEPWHDRLRRAARRHQPLVAATIALMIGLPLAGSIAVWQLSKLRSQALAAQSIAEARDEAARKVADYLVKTFQTADPIAYDATGFHTAGPRSADATLRRMLDNGNALISTHLLDKPELRCQLLTSIGDSYRGLAEFDKAREALEEAHRLASEHFRHEAPQVFDSKFHLARLEHEMGNYREAEQLYRQIIAGRLQSDPASRLAVADAQYHLAWLMFFQPMGIDTPQFDAQKVSESVELFKQVVKTRRALLPKRDRAIGLALVGLAAAQTTTGHNPLAGAASAADAVDVFENSEGENLVGKVHAQYLQAEMLRKYRQFDAAEILYLQILKLAKEHLGPEHPVVVLHMWNMAGMYNTMAAFDKAEATVTEIRRLVRNCKAVRSCPAHIDGLLKYGSLLMSKDAERAKLVFQEALQFAQERPQQNARLIGDLKARL